MRIFGQVVLMIAALSGLAAAQQPVQPSSTSPDPRVVRRDERERPPTPDELVQEEIRRFDPLDQNDGREEKKNEAEKDKHATDGRNDRRPAALPGSIAAETQTSVNRKREPRIVADQDSSPVEEEYTGPAVLSRAYTLNRPLIAQDVTWAETVGLSSTFNTGANAAAPGVAGTVANTGTIYGTTFSWGITGRKRWRHDEFSTVLNGQYQRNYGVGAYNGPNTLLGLNYTHELSRRLSVTFTENGSMYSQNYTLQNPAAPTGTSIANINITSSPNVQIFDTATKQFASQADVTFQKTTRLSFSAGVTYFAIIRDSATLIGNTGEQARGDVTYRWSRKTTLGPYYSFSHYAYPKGLGVTDTNTAGMVYSYGFSRSLQLRLRAGLSSTQSLGFQVVELDPLVAALLGRRSGIIDVFRPFKSADLSGQLTKDFKSGRTVSLAYVRGISPGNGVFQASIQETVGVTAAARLRRAYTMQFSGSHEKLTSASQTTGSYGGYNAQIATGRTFRGGFAYSFQIGFRSFELSSAQAARNQIQVSSGITWSPDGGKLWPL